MYLAAFMQTFRKFTEHLGMASFDPLQGTRTVLPRKWLLRLSSFLNFDIFVHGPHHRHPRLTHDKLESKLDEYRARIPDVTYPDLRAVLAGDAGDGAVDDLQPRLRRKRRHARRKPTRTSTRPTTSPATFWQSSGTVG